MLNDDYGIPESEPQRERSRPPWIEAIGAITLALLFAALILSSILDSNRSQPTSYQTATAQAAPTSIPTAHPTVKATQVPTIPAVLSTSSTFAFVPSGPLARLGKGQISDLTYSPDGDFFAVGGAAGVFVYRADTFEEMWSSDTPNWVTSVAWSPSLDGSILASGSGDSTVILWDAAFGGRLRTLVGHTHTISSVTWSPDGTHLATALWDGTIHNWDVTNLR